MQFWNQPMAAANCLVTRILQNIFFCSAEERNFTLFLCSHHLQRKCLMNIATQMAYFAVPRPVWFLSSSPDISWTRIRSVGQHRQREPGVWQLMQRQPFSSQKFLRVELMGAVEGVIAVLESKLWDTIMSAE